MNNNKKFYDVSARQHNSKWSSLIRREIELYNKEHDIRTPFERDYTRILHSLSYRRLKHKTQVFFTTNNDHICTRIEHVSHVESVSYTIAKELGLNAELTKAIAVGHDLGHAPFGHAGESVLKELTEKYLKTQFWHEKNGLRFVDNVELLEDEKRHFHNLNLTYAVRDGIISHCGEVNDTCIFPRDEYIDLNEFIESGQYQAYTWEGCVVKLADKIAYVGRDIEDAKRLKILSKEQLYDLKRLAQKYKLDSLNTTSIIHDLIIDICKNSSPESGLKLSPMHAEMLLAVKEYNYKNIYGSDRLLVCKNYIKLVINSIFETLLRCYSGKDTLKVIKDRLVAFPELMSGFSLWLLQRSDIDANASDFPSNIQMKCENIKIYKNIETKNIYIQAIIDYIAGMTDQYALKIFDELVRF